MSEQQSLSPGEIDLFAALAIDAKAGEKFTVAGRELTRAFLRIDAEDALTAVILKIVQSAPGKPLEQLLMGALPLTRQAAAIIIADHDLADDGDLDAAIAAAATWIATTRGVTNAALLDLVLKQIRLQEMGVLLGGLWRASVQLAAVMGDRSHPPTLDA